MLSIGAFAKAANISPRTVRHYESLGLIKASVRGDNNYRYFDRAQIEVVTKIRDLQKLGFSLEEISDVLTVSVGEMTKALQGRLDAVHAELRELNERRERLTDLLHISRRVGARRAIDSHERRLFMDAVKHEVIEGVRRRQGAVSEAHVAFLRRENYLYDAPEKIAYLAAIKQCVEFARQHQLTLGPGRGTGPASLSMFGFGFSSVDPTAYHLIPERMSYWEPDMHIDVEYERGQMFVDYCRDVSAQLKWGKINAFKMPLLDIINRVHARIGGAIDYAAIPDDSDIVHAKIRAGDIDKIFLLDMSPNALVMRYENHFPAYVGNEKIKAFLRSQEIVSFRDLVNIIALWRPSNHNQVERIERYRRAKLQPVRYDFLSQELQAMLAPNFGLPIYHEDLIHIIAAYTGWDLGRSNKMRRDLFVGLENADLAVFKSLAPKPVVDLVLTELPWTFCRPHAIASSSFTKQTAVLRTLHEDIYFQEIDRWQTQHGLVWDDIGIKLKGVSLLQH